MKKSYIKPVAEAVTLEPLCLSAASPVTVSENENTGAGLLNDIEVSNDRNVLSKQTHFDVWED